MKRIRSSARAAGLAAAGAVLGLALLGGTPAYALIDAVVSATTASELAAGLSGGGIAASEVGEPITASFTTTAGTTLYVEGIELQVFELGDAASVQAALDAVAGGAGSADAAFFTNDSLLVVVPGATANESLIARLSAAFGGPGILTSGTSGVIDASTVTSAEELRALLNVSGISTVDLGVEASRGFVAFPGSTFEVNGSGQIEVFRFPSGADADAALGTMVPMGGVLGVPADMALFRSGSLLIGVEDVSASAELRGMLESMFGMPALVTPADAAALEAATSLMSRLRARGIDVMMTGELGSAMFTPNAGARVSLMGVSAEVFPFASEGDLQAALDLLIDGSVTLPESAALFRSGTDLVLVPNASADIVAGLESALGSGARISLVSPLDAFATLAAALGALGVTVLDTGMPVTASFIPGAGVEITINGVPAQLFDLESATAAAQVLESVTAPANVMVFRDEARLIVLPRASAQPAAAAVLEQAFGPAVISTLATQVPGPAQVPAPASTGFGVTAEQAGSNGASAAAGLAMGVMLLIVLGGRVLTGRTARARR